MNEKKDFVKMGLEKKYPELTVETGRISRPTDMAIESSCGASLSQINKGSGKCHRKTSNYRHCRVDREKRGIISRELP